MIGMTAKNVKSNNLLSWDKKDKKIFSVLRLKIILRAEKLNKYLKILILNIYII